MKPIECTWLIILVIHDFDDSRFTEIIELVLKEFTSVGSIDKNQVLLIHNKIEIDKDKKIRFNTLLRKLELKSSDSNEPLEFNFKSIPEAVEGLQFHDQREWENLLGWIKKAYKWEKLILTTLSHGAGVGIRGGQDTDPSKFHMMDLSKKIISLDRLPNKTKGYFTQLENLDDNFQLIDKYLIYQNNAEDEFCKKLEMLWISELADALKKSLGTRKVDILMMANCFMQTFEAGWILRKQAKYLVAPETVFKAYGYSFSGLLNVLNRRPEIKPKELLKTIIPDFIAKMKSDSIESRHLRMVTVVITCLRYYGILKFLLDRISVFLIKLTDTQLDQIPALRQTIQNSSNYPLNDRKKPEADPIKYEFIDLNYFLLKLNLIFKYNFLYRLNAFLFRRISSSATRHMYVGDDYITHDLFINRKFGLHGISIFMPRNLTTSKKGEIINCAYFGTSEITVGDGPDIALESFVKTSLWDEFIKKYIIRLTVTAKNKQQLPVTTDHSKLPAV